MSGLVARGPALRVPSGAAARAVVHAVVALGVAALSALVLPVAPGYDAYAWLTWGREVGRLELSTVDGPAWKPLPVMVTALLAPAGDLAPPLFVILVRAGAVAAVGLAFVCARRLAGTAAGVLAAALVFLTGGFVRHAAVGDAEPVLVALLLGAFLLALDDRHRAALAVGAAAALLRPEVWPFLGLYGLWRWRAAPGERPLLAGLALAVPALWFVPEWLGSGELLRSSDRARIPNPGQPATAERPAWETLRGAADVVLLPATFLALLARGPAAFLGAAGAAWIALVALMSEAGFSGEPRYVLPGAALLAVAGAAGTARLREGRTLPASAGEARLRDGRPSLGGRPLFVIAVVALAVAGALRAGDLGDLRPRLAYTAALDRDLDRAIDAAGGRAAVLACGRPAVGRFRGTLLAWHLDVAKRVVRADGRPDAVTFTSRLTAASPPSPPPGRVVARAGAWQVSAACRGSGTARRAPPSRAGRR